MKTGPMSPMLALAAVVLLAAAAPAPAQTRVVTSAHRYCWAENTGFLNWRDAGNGARSARLHPTFLSGHIWGENIGWINLGDGTPETESGRTYANTDGSDAGVNRNASTDELSGLAWGENVGWINFSGGALAIPPDPARYDPATGRLRGYAWSENVGWINLDDADVFVAFRCPSDFNESQTVTVQDLFDFLSAWFAISPAADFNFTGSITVQDLFDFLVAWFAQC